MLVEINLLPKKEEKNITLYLIVVIFVLLLVAGTTFFYFYLNGKKQDIKMLENQLTMSQQIVEEQNQKLATFESSSSVVELKNAIGWAKEQPFNMVYVLKELTKSLPQRGFILDFEMDEKNVIKQKVQFDTKSEAAYYLTSVLQYPWVDEAVISDAKTTDILKNNSNTSDLVKTAIDILNKANIEPRYYAQYEIRLNIPQLNQTIKKQKKKNSDNGEGGNTP